MKTLFLDVVALNKMPQATGLNGIPMKNQGLHKHHKRKRNDE